MEKGHRSAAGGHCCIDATWHSNARCTTHGVPSIWFQSSSSMSCRLFAEQADWFLSLSASHAVGILGMRGMDLKARWKSRPLAFTPQERQCLYFTPISVVYLILVCIISSSGRSTQLVLPVLFCFTCASLLTRSPPSRHVSNG